MSLCLQTIELEQMCELITDGTHYSPTSLSVGEYRYLTSKNVRRGQLDLADITYVTGEIHKGIYAGCPVQPGDVLLVKDGVNTGTAAINTLREPFSMLSSVALLRPRQELLDARFLMHWLNSPLAQYQMTSNMSGSAIRRLVLRQIRRTKLPIPDLATQQRIAAILDKAEALRSQRQKAITRLSCLKESIFLETFGDPATNSGSLPLVALGELFSESPCYGSMIPPQEQGHWTSLRVGNIQDWKLDLTDEKFIDLPANTVRRFSLQDGDIVLARAIASQNHLGKCIVVYPKGRQWAFDSHLMRLRFNLNRILPEYLSAMFRTSGGRSLFLSVTRRSAVQFNVNTKEMAALRIPLAPIELQRRFLVEMTSAQQSELRQQHSASSLGNLFYSLQHRSFRGEL